MCLWRLWVGTSYTSSKIRTEVPVMAEITDVLTFCSFMRVTAVFFHEWVPIKDKSTSSKTWLCWRWWATWRSCFRISTARWSCLKKARSETGCSKTGSLRPKPVKPQNKYWSVSFSIAIFKFWLSTGQHRQSEAKGSFTIQPHKRWANWGFNGIFLGHVLPLTFGISTSGHPVKSSILKCLNQLVVACLAQSQRSAFTQKQL